MGWVSPNPSRNDMPGINYSAKHKQWLFLPQTGAVTSLHPALAWFRADALPASCKSPQAAASHPADCAKMQPSSTCVDVCKSVMKTQHHCHAISMDLWLNFFVNVILYLNDQIMACNRSCIRSHDIILLSLWRPWNMILITGEFALTLFGQHNPTP